VDTRIKVAAAIQLTVGILNLLAMSWMASLFWFSFGGLVSMLVMTICTLGLCPLPIGSACAAVGPFIAVVGILEIIAGAAGLIRPETSRPLTLVVAVLGVLSILLANPISVVGGVVVLAMLMTPGDPEGVAAAPPVEVAAEG